MPGITDPSEEYFKDGIWGWNGSAWRKAGLHFSYSDQVLGQVVETNAAAGTNTLSGSSPAAGEIWVITAMEIHNTASAVNTARLAVRASSVNYWLAASPALAAKVGLSWSGVVILAYGDVPYAGMWGCTANDDLYFHYLGYKMTV